MTSVKLCGGILVAIPTAIPEEPFTNKGSGFASWQHSTASCSLPS